MNHIRNKAGFTILEVLIAVIIIAILASILIPTLGRRSEDARLKVCQQELREIANAEERAAIDNGYYFRLYVLDDVSGGDGVGLGERDSNGVLDPVDGIDDESNGISNFIYLNSENMFISVDTGKMIEADALIHTAFTKITDETSYGADAWKGPYYNIHNDDTIAEDRSQSEWENYKGFLPDIPNDPWGNDYIFATEAGVVQEPDGVIADTFSISSISGDNPIRPFDRPTIISLGPNRVPGDEKGPDGNASTTADNYTLGTGDDLIYSFGY
jgi:prepilin-type N-terminal cleavage/methylation domain-containing protein